MEVQLCHCAISAATLASCSAFVSGWRPYLWSGQLQVTPIASTFSDNFFYALEDGEDILLVDPVDAQAAIDWLHGRKPERLRVLITHGHPDHVAGNDQLVSELGVQVLAPATAEFFPVKHDVGLSDGDLIELGSTTLKAIHAPGHTDDHMVYHAGDLLISGDVFFTAGVGHTKAGGDIAELYKTVHRRLAGLPDSTILHVGHEYVVKNSAFARELLPDDDAVAALSARAQAWTRADGPLRTTLGEERRHNPFLRVGERAVQEAAAALAPEVEGADELAPAERAFRQLRAWRDNY